MFLSSILTMLEKYVWPISIMLLAIVTTASLLPLPVLPEVPGSDKTHHFVSYALIVLPVFIIKPKYWWVFLLCVVAWGGAIELIQPLVNRYGEWLDLLANTGGVVIGCIVGMLLKMVLMK